VLGLISYGVYLWHWPVYVVVDTERTGLGDWSLFGVRVGITLAIAAASYLIIEQPVRRGALSGRSWHALTPAFAVGIVLLVIATTWRSVDPVAVSDTLPASATAFDRAAGRVRVLVVGDSVAISLFPGLQRAARDANLDVVSGATLACRAQLDDGEVNDDTPQRSRCEPDWGRLVERLDPDVVLMVDSGVWSLRDERVGDRVLRLASPAWDANITTQWQEALDTFSATGARVVMPTMAYTRARNDHAGDTSSVFNPKAVDHANDTLAGFVAQNRDRVQLVDLQGFVCPNGRFQEPLGPVAVARPDGVHYGTEGSIVVGRWLARHLAAAGEPQASPANAIDPSSPQ
jgi:hypothetical protein